MATYCPVYFGGAHTSQAQCTLYSQFTGFNFLPIAWPIPKEEHVMKSSKAAKKRVLLNASDSDDEPNDNQKRLI